MLFCAVFLLSLRLMGSFFLLNLSCKLSIPTHSRVYRRPGVYHVWNAVPSNLREPPAGLCLYQRVCPRMFLSRRHRPTRRTVHPFLAVPWRKCVRKIFYTNHILFLGFVFLVHLISTLWWLAQVLHKSYRLIHFLTLEMYSIALHILLRPGRVVDKFCELHFTLCCCRSLLFG